MCITVAMPPDLEISIQDEEHEYSNRANDKLYVSAQVTNVKAQKVDHRAVVVTLHV